MRKAVGQPHFDCEKVINPSCILKLGLQDYEYLEHLLQQDLTHLFGEVDVQEKL